MNIIPKSTWLVKDNKKSIRIKSHNVQFPISNENKNIMEKLIYFVKYSQDKKKNINNEIIPAVGLAAPQIGKNINMYYVRLNKEVANGKITEYALINSKIVGMVNQFVALESGEGCLSVSNNYEGYVHRSYKIIVEGYDYIQKKNIKIEAKGYLAIVLQHEQDHLIGKLYYDYINKKNPWEQKKDAIYL